MLAGCPARPSKLTIEMPDVVQMDFVLGAAR